MELSKYQTDICKFFKSGAGNTAVIAVAGSGKSTTALQAISGVPSFYQTLLGAFNKDIKLDFEAKGRALGCKNTKYTTFNGFGWGTCLNAMRGAPPVLDEDKTANILELVVMRPRTKADERRLQKLKGTISRLVGLFRLLSIHSVAEAESRYEEVVNHQNIDIPEDDDFKELLFRTFEECINDTVHFDFTDQVYMPIHMGFNIPCYDIVTIDEFQDCCQIELELMAQAARGGRFIAIGDPDQSIYGFKGCDPRRFTNYIRDFNAKELPLSICYRCPINIIMEARKIVSRIEAAPGAKAGVVDTVEKSVFHRDHREGDFVICRVTEHLVRECIADIRAGRKAKVRGRDFGNSCIALLGKITEDSNLAADEFVTQMFEYRIKQSEILKKFRRENEIIRLDDRVNTLHALAEGCSDVKEVIARTNDIFCEDKDRHQGVDFLTGHKSKGLQKKRVWILRPDLLPHPRSQERDWMIAEEKRLKYVMITRAEEELYYVLKSPGER